MEKITLQPNGTLLSDEDRQLTDVTDEESKDPLQLPCDDTYVPSTLSTSKYNTLQLLRSKVLDMVSYYTPCYTKYYRSRYNSCIFG